MSRCGIMKKLFSRSFLIFCIIGALNTLVHLAVFNLLIETNTLLANSVAFIAASLFSYWANATFTYKTEMESKTFVFSLLTFFIKLLLSNALTLGFEHLFFSINQRALIKFIPIPVTLIILPLQFFAFNLIFLKKKT